MTKRYRGARNAEEYTRRRGLAEKLRRRGLESLVYEAGAFQMGAGDAEKILALIEVAREMQRMEEGE